MGITMQVLGLLLSLSILVLVHELGHYFFARIFKTRVEKFYLFFNPWFSIMRAKKIEGKWNFSFFSSTSPEHWKDHPETTEWGIGWLPLGGYCSIAGMVDETKGEKDLSAEPQEWEFRSKPAWQRFFIIIGGVLVNFIIALVLYSVILFKWGEEYIPLENARYGLQFSEVALKTGFENGDKIIDIDGEKPETIGDFVTGLMIDDVQKTSVLRGDDTLTVYIPSDFGKQVLADPKKGVCQYVFPFVIDSIIPNMPAAMAQLQKGDSLVAINDSSLFSFYDFQSLFNEHKNETITLSYYRQNELLHSQILLNEEGKIGVYPAHYLHFLKTKKNEYGFFTSIPKGISLGFNTLGVYVKQFKLVFSKEGATQLGGFGTIGSIFPKTWNWQQFWSMTALLSIILAFMNFLPIPALDGGYILFILVEMITRRKPSDKFVGYANMVGFTLLIALVLYANGMDIIRALGF